MTVLYPDVISVLVPDAVFKSNLVTCERFWNAGDLPFAILRVQLFRPPIGAETFPHLEAEHPPLASITH